MMITENTAPELKQAAQRLNKETGKLDLDKISDILLADVHDPKAADIIYAVMGDEMSALGRQAQLPIRVDGIVNRIEIQALRLKNF